MKKKFVFSKFFIFIIAVIFILVFSSYTASSQNELEIAKKYAPILYFEAEETCYPIDASYHIDNSELYEMTENGAVLIPEWDESYLTSQTNSVYFLDNTKGNPDNNGVINHYNQYKNSYDTTVYYRVSQDGSYVQYWMFYAFNDGELNRHEGDWEMVQVLYSSSGGQKVGYSQHLSGQSATWDLVEHEDNNIVVYVSRGSHANYLRSYSGKVGMANDNVGSNGVVLRYSEGDYVLKDLETQSWLDYPGRWGEIFDESQEGAGAAILNQLLGKNGPEGPKFRTSMSSGELWDGNNWVQGLMPANENWFLEDWLVYKIFKNFSLYTLLIIALLIFTIYRRNKKNGLGPRKVSMFYIDGFNLKSIGNIVCFVAIIIVLVGLFLPWYTVSYSFSSEGLLSDLDTPEMTELMNINGMNGIQITLPGQGGTMPFGAIVIPFSLIIAIGLILFVISTIGIFKSKKLGTKYILKGIKIFIPIFLVIIIILVISSIIPSQEFGGADNDIMTDALSSFTSSPLGGQDSISIDYQGIVLPLELKWGLGIGAYLLIFGGIVFIAAGIIEFSSKEFLFQPKNTITKKHKGQNVPKMVPPPPSGDIKEQKNVEKDNTNKCPNCGKELKKDSSFCTECGNKIS